ncbi:MAG: 1,4-alpha-glucan-branching protein [Bacteroidetes bacterium]|uniref:alpha-amylase family glycosyl hydrolase n=1 Tax=Phnomibacter sp. TaxID=2836217 RepID=UPI002FDD4F0B|nr:1,4-alpha-glucan-branching protein [Bacteroidota bacterium]
MMKIRRILSLVVLFMTLGLVSGAQLLSLSNQFPGESATITVTMDANFGNKGLLNATASDVYVHTGVITNLSTSPTSWRYMKFNQNFNQPNPSLQATSLGNNRWQFTITDIRNFYGVPAGEQIQKISILFRNGAGTQVQRNADGSDMYIQVYGSGLQTTITNPFKAPTFIPSTESINKNLGESIAVSAAASQAANMRLLYNGLQIASQSGVTTITATPTITTAGQQVIKVEADNGGAPVVDSISFFVAPATEVEALPAGMQDGANYSNDQTSVTLVLYAPNKTSAAVVGDFNNWTQTLQHQMKRTPDGLRYWVTINGLTPGNEYAYQYVIDNNLRVADYMTEKVLDPWNDPFINQAPYTNRYPNLKAYPTGKASGIVSVLEPGKASYNWSSATTNFQKPDKRNLVVYELLLRDFVANSSWNTLRDTLAYISRLGVNAIHLMPFTEFEGNNSWGYNPMFMFAADKIYGPENTLKEFIDSCHGRGIAVILDMVLNHQFGQSPMVQMYWDAANNRPANNSPWFNPVPKHGFNVGYDMNHEAPATIKFVEDVMRHWLTKFKLDGFRWDLSKGFTQTQTCDNNGGNCNVGTWSAYDQSRVNIWQRIYNQSQAISPNAYMILEHLGVDQEEATLANMGMLLWGKMTDQYNEASMGYTGSSSNFDRAFHTTRWSSFGGNNTPHLMAYAESHDEERLAFKNVRFGNSGPSHNTKSLSVYARRMQSVAAFLFTTPGPKMMWQFGELSYDSSINMCENFTIGDCRTSPKPPAWAMPNPLAPASPINYNANTFRRTQRDMFGKIISLRTKYPSYLPTFVTNDVDFSLNGAFKWQRIKSNALKLVVMGNFDVQAQSGIVQFPTTGTWYVYAHNLQAFETFTAVNAGLSASGITINAGAESQTFNLPAGAFIIFTDKDVTAVVTQFTFTGNGNWSNPANWQGGNIPPSVLPAGSTITVNPTAGGESVLDVSLTVQQGATLQVAAGKTLRITGNLIRQ